MYKSRLTIQMHRIVYQEQEAYGKRENLSTTIKNIKKYHLLHYNGHPYFGNLLTDTEMSYLLGADASRLINQVATTDIFKEKCSSCQATEQGMDKFERMIEQVREARRL